MRPVYTYLLSALSAAVDWSVNADVRSHIQGINRMKLIRRTAGRKKAYCNWMLLRLETLLVQSIHLSIAGRSFTILVLCGLYLRHRTTNCRAQHSAYVPHGEWPSHDCNGRDQEINLGGSIEADPCLTIPGL